MYFLIHYFVLWPCGMAIFVTLFLYIYNIKQGSNLYIYMVDLILEHDIMVDLVLEHDMCGSCMCANLNEFPILKGRI